MPERHASSSAWGASTWVVIYGAQVRSCWKCGFPQPHRIIVLLCTSLGFPGFYLIITMAAWALCQPSTGGLCPSWLQIGGPMRRRRQNFGARETVATGDLHFFSLWTCSACQIICIPYSVADPSLKISGDLGVLLMEGFHHLQNLQVVLYPAAILCLGLVMRTLGLFCWYYSPPVI